MRMLRQVYEVRANRNTVSKQIEFQNIIRKEAIDRTETSLGGPCRMTQKQFNEAMKQADEVARKW